MTNELGHRLARDYGGGTETLGAYRYSRVPWIPGATIDVWVPCVRADHVTGVPYPHVYFIQTVGGRTAEDGSIYCPTCRVEVAAIRASGVAVPPPPMKTPAAPAAPKPPKPPKAPQSDLPF